MTEEEIKLRLFESIVANVENLDCTSSPKEVAWEVKDVYARLFTK